MSDEIEIEIEHGIPIPGRQARQLEAVFDNMKKGDSILAPAENYRSFYEASRRHGIKFKRKYCGRSVKDSEGNRTYRIWRIK